jgi:hypothetical protein
MAKHLVRIPKRCDNCGTRFLAERINARFCKKQCRKNWQTRAAIRGAIAYPLLLEWRRRRSGGHLSDICQLVDVWLADEKQRSRDNA